MVIENTVICVDNSEYARNEDFFPSRLEAQCEAAGFIAQTMLASHPENHVGIVTLSNNRVVTNLSIDEVRLLNQIYKITFGGLTRFLQGIAVAQMMLKHCPVRSRKSRIIGFVGSPIQLSEIEATSLGKRLKKCSIFLDIVKFGDEGDKNHSLELIVDSMNRNSLSENRLVKVPTGVSIPNFLVSSGILQNVRNERTPRRSQEDEELRMALELSLREAGRTGGAERTSTVVARNSLTEEQQYEMAIQLSLQEAVNNETVESGNDAVNAKNKQVSPIENIRNGTNSRIQLEETITSEDDDEPNHCDAENSGRDGGHSSSSQSSKRNHDGECEPDSKRHKPSEE